MTMPLVSWLMPVYNADKYVRRAMDSMLNQTYQHFEILIIAEYGCSDRTVAICSEYASKDERVRLYVNQQKLGIVRSLNRGLDLCGGKYIARMDADDVSNPNRLDRQVCYMEENEDVAVLGTWSRVSSENEGESVCEHPTEGEKIRAELLLRDVISHPTVMLRADLFRMNRWYYPEEEAEDYALWAQIISKAKFANLPEILLTYHQHGENATSTKFREVRRWSAFISKRAVMNELGVETSAYPDIFFGWRGFHDTVPNDLCAFLLSGARLLCEIKSANDRLHKFDDAALSWALQRHWQMTKEIAHLGFLTVDYDSVPVTDMKSLTAQLKDIVSPQMKALIYGTGRHCKNTLLKARDEYPFNIIGVCDSDTEKQGTEFFGRKVIAPEEISNVDYDYILVASPLYEREIRKRLISEFRVPQDKILNLPSAGDLPFFCSHMKYEEGKEI